jgi:hypothetical protein
MVRRSARLAGSPVKHQQMTFKGKKLRIPKRKSSRRASPTRKIRHRGASPGGTRSSARLAGRATQFMQIPERKRKSYYKRKTNRRSPRSNLLQILSTSLPKKQGSQQKKRSPARKHPQRSKIIMGYHHARKGKSNKVRRNLFDRQGENLFHYNLKHLKRVHPLGKARKSFVLLKPLRSLNHNGKTIIVRWKAVKTYHGRTAGAAAKKAYTRTKSPKIYLLHRVPGYFRNELKKGNRSGSKYRGSIFEYRMSRKLLPVGKSRIIKDKNGKVIANLNHKSVIESRKRHPFRYRIAGGRMISNDPVNAQDVHTRIGRKGRKRSMRRKGVKGPYSSENTTLLHKHAFGTKGRGKKSRGPHSESATLLRHHKYAPTEKRAKRSGVHRRRKHSPKKHRHHRKAHPLPVMKKQQHHHHVKKAASPKRKKRTGISSRQMKALFG